MYTVASTLFYSHVDILVIIFTRINSGHLFYNLHAAHFDDPENNLLL